MAFGTPRAVETGNLLGLSLSLSLTAYFPVFACHKLGSGEEGRGKGVFEPPAMPPVRKINKIGREGGREKAENAQRSETRKGVRMTLVP